MATPLADIELALLDAFITDAIFLAFPTPADVNVVPNGTNVDPGDSVQDGIGRLPPVIITDLPYLLLPLVENWIITYARKYPLTSPASGMKPPSNTLIHCTPAIPSWRMGLMSNHVVYLPIPQLVATSPRSMNTHGRTWERILTMTNQPNTAPLKVKRLREAGY